ncbi:hypothetical protein GCM10027027_11980 [Neomicrococcus lactis]
MPSASAARTGTADVPGGAPVSKPGPTNEDRGIGAPRSIGTASCCPVISPAVRTELGGMASEAKFTVARSAAAS